MAKDSIDHQGVTIHRGASGLFVLGAALRVLSYFFSKNSGGDALERAALSARWLQHPTFQLVFDVYPPGHFWLIGALALLVPDVTVASRLLSLLLGIASMFLVWKLARTLYSDAAGLFSLAVFALYSLHIGYSTTSSSEVPYLFFVLLAAVFFFSYFKEPTRRLWYLGISGIALSVAGSIRFEAWILFGALCLVFPLLWNWVPVGGGRMKLAVAPLMAFGITGAAWPIIMMLYCWRTYGDPMYLIADTHARMAHVLVATGNSLAHELALIPVVLLVTLSPLAFAAAIYGIAGSRRLPLAAAFAGVTLFFMAVQEYEILHGGTLAVARYTLTPGALLAVISGEGFERVCQRLLPRRTRLAQVVVIGLLLLNLGAILAISEVPNRLSDKFAAFSPRLRYSTRISGVGQYLRQHMVPQDAVVIDDYNVESNIIADAAGLPLLHGDRAYLASSKNEIDVRQYIDREHPRFLVYSDQGTLRNSLTLPRDCNQVGNVDGIEFRCDYSSQIYRVYELTYR
jgi:4-amino-4-deoxy-L-arabinose transferase-like glycosyltransferase